MPKFLPPFRQPLKCRDVTVAPGLPYCGFRRLLRGDIRSPRPAASHRPAALFAGGREATCPHLRNSTYHGHSTRILSLCQG